MQAKWHKIIDKYCHDEKQITGKLFLEKQGIFGVLKDDYFEIM